MWCSRAGAHAKDDDLEASFKDLLDRDGRGVGLPSAALSKNRKGFAGRFDGKAKLPRKMQGGPHGSYLDRCATSDWPAVHDSTASPSHRTVSPNER
jgi:hypothetical protein